MAGDLHAGFDSGVFTVGALGGVASIASAVGAGFANYMAAQRDR